MQTYKVLITTSGTGSRLGELTKYTNKSLVRVGLKPVISYIVDAYPKNIELVITIGHFGNQVMEFIRLAYPDRKITFVEIENFSGPGSSLGYSMLQAKKYLQCPFIFHAGDTVVFEKIPGPLVNWNGGYKGQDTAMYSSFDVIGDEVQSVKEKGATDFDYLHIGLVGFHDYQKFWETLELVYWQNVNDPTLNDCRVINHMIKDGVKFISKEFKTWYDVGNAERLNQARRSLVGDKAVLDKIDESVFIYKDKNYVIKFFFDKNLVKQRLERAKILKALVPKIEASGKNFYRYRYVKGDILSRVATPANFPHFLKWLGDNLWRQTKEVSNKKFKEVCQDFYINKTKVRLKTFFSKKNLLDKAQIINGEKIPPLAELMKKIDTEWLCDAQQSNFHGDLILDNIVRTKTGYYLMDWRQNFGGLLKAGDKYYDLAKLNHNLIVNHDIVNANLFTIDIKGNQVECDIMRKNNLVECQEIYRRFLTNNNYDLKKVNLLTAIIWLNMSPLHQHPVDLFLFHFGKLHLWRALNQNIS